MKNEVKNVRLSYETWKVLKQHSLDIDKPIKEIVEKLVEENIKG